jgi:hypothetical protein
LALIRLSRSRFHSSSAPPLVAIGAEVVGADEAVDAEDEEESATAGALVEAA